VQPKSQYLVCYQCSVLVIVTSKLSLHTDFDEDDYLTPIPFGRSASGGHGLFASTGQESPTLASTPLPDRQFNFHSRGDSVTSEDSNHSVRYGTRKTSVPFAHSSQSSVATVSSPFSKKTSFASLRNAFKTGKTWDAPPVPSIDHQAYPAALKNPFSRSTSSLAHIPPPPPSNRRPSVNISPTHYSRAPTPGSSESKSARGTSRSKSHAYARSQHSHSGSLFYSSDTGSDLGHGYIFNPSFSPPPVPPVPNGFGLHNSQDDTSPLFDYDDKVVMDPQTPSDYALHAIFIRFARSAEMKIELFMKEPLERDPPLPQTMGPGVDPNFEDILNSLGRVAEKHAKQVLDSIMRWRRSQNESVSSDVARRHMTQSPGTSRGVRVQDAHSLLTERKSLAAIYIMCRALISVVQSLPKDALGETTGYSLEETMFDQFKKPDLKLLAQSANHRYNAELYAKLLGLLANVRSAVL
jgi:Cell morphogenesis N-terminal